MWKGTEEAGKWSKFASSGRLGLIFDEGGTHQLADGQKFLGDGERPNAKGGGVRERERANKLVFNQASYL